MDYSDLTELYNKISSSSKRLDKVGFISDFMRSVSLGDVEDFILLLQGRVYPAWDEGNVGVANKTIIKVISSSTNATQEEVIDLWKEEGDLGKVCKFFHSKKKQANLASKKLTINKVVSNLRKIGEVSGEGSVSSKMLLLSELVSFAEPDEALYIIRTVMGDLQIGVGEGVIKEAIVWCFFPKIKGINSEEDGLFVSVEEELENLVGSEVISLSDYTESRKMYKFFMGVVERAYDVSNDFGLVIKKIKENGFPSLRDISLVPGRPFNVMLAVASSIEDALESVGVPAQVEFKYDGFRVQIHKMGEDVLLFTRKLENVTNKFPDIVQVVKDLNVGSVVLDAEVVGYDKDTGVYLPFQNISQRINRKHSIDKLAKDYPVEINVFDVLYKDDKPLNNLKLSERLEVLKEIIPNNKGKICVAKSIISSNKEEIKNFFKDAKDVKAEGLMIKSLSSPYISGRKVGNMFKYKEVMENLDVVIVGGEWGKGKRTNWLSSFDIACRVGDEFLPIGKVATGLKEKSSEGFSFEELTKLLEPLIVGESEKHVKITPKIVIEVSYEEIQKSPNYSSGYALRFPRFIRLREDKSVNEISDKDYIKKLFDSQTS